MRIWWSDEAESHIAERAQRYVGAFNLTVAMAEEAASDPVRVVIDPDPKSHVGAARLIGASTTAGRILTIVFDPISGRGYSAWPASQADQRTYLAGGHDDDES